MSDGSVDFHVSDGVRRLGLRGEYFILTGLKPDVPAGKLDALVAEAESEVPLKWSPEAIASDAILSGFANMHEAVGRGGRKNVASSTNLISAILAGGRLPRVNAVVDVYNVVSITTGLALGAHDLSSVNGNIALRLSVGNEQFVPLGRSNHRGIGAGEYIYADDANDVLCRMETRQVEKTKVTADTTSCFYIVQGHAAIEPQTIRQAADRCIELTRMYCGGQLRQRWSVT